MYILPKTALRLTKWLSEVTRHSTAEGKRFENDLRPNQIPTITRDQMFTWCSFLKYRKRKKRKREKKKGTTSVHPGTVRQTVVCVSRALNFILKPITKPRWYHPTYQTMSTGGLGGTGNYFHFELEVRARSRNLEPRIDRVLRFLIEFGNEIFFQMEKT